MNAQKRKRLEAAGWRFGGAGDFLNLTFAGIYRSAKYGVNNSRSGMILIPENCTETRNFHPLGRRHPANAG